MDGDIDASFMGSPYTKVSLGPLGGVFMKKKADEEFYYEVPHNPDGLMYDEANELIEKHCKGVDMSGVHTLKFHTNTWGLSSSNLFADEYIPKMKKLQKIDFSDTVKMRYRSDCPNGCKAILFAAKDFNIIHLDVSYNNFEDNGAKSFAEFMELNSTLKVLKAHGCGFGKISVEMMVEASKKNPKLQLTDLDMGRNMFCDESLELLATFIKGQKELENLNVEQNIKDHKAGQHKFGLKHILEAVYERRHQIRRLDISGNYGVNSEGALDVLQKYI